MNITIDDAIRDRVVQRVYAEFLEMPGLRVTCHQAQRLWGLDERTCRRVLQCLVDAEFLCEASGDLYARRPDAPAGLRPSRAVKATRPAALN